MKKYLCHLQISSVFVTFTVTFLITKLIFKMSKRWIGQTHDAVYNNDFIFWWKTSFPPIWHQVKKISPFCSAGLLAFELSPGCRLCIVFFLQLYHEFWDELRKLRSSCFRCRCRFFWNLLEELFIQEIKREIKAKNWADQGSSRISVFHLTDIVISWSISVQEWLKNKSTHFITSRLSYCNSLLSGSPEM